MSFQHYKQHNQGMQRKENDSFLAHHFKNISLTLKERTSPSASRGSITLEASIATGLFLFAVLCLVYLFEIMALQTGVKSALHTVSREVAEKSYISSMISTINIEKRLVQLIGKERLDDSLIAGGGKGLDCSGSKKYLDTTIMDLKVRYQIEIPIAMFHIPIITKEETIRVKGWTGRDNRNGIGLGNTMVYVTDYGIVYHADANCSYLELSLKSVPETDVKNARNENGEKYKECSACSHFSSEVSNVYVTSYGNRYHKSLECSKIQRNMHVVPLEDVYGLGGCSKCVK